MITNRTAIGGDIDPATGAVTLPDTALFAQGSAELSPQTTLFLNAFCTPWIETLSRFGPSIGALRIEGHASTEWRSGMGGQQAFLNNMALSQERASTVLDYCLRRPGDEKINQWAQSRLVAVGFSSAKPIMDNEIENPTKSRRVVFRVDIDKSQVIEGIEQDLAFIEEKKHTTHGVQFVQKDPSGRVGNWSSGDIAILFDIQTASPRWLRAGATVLSGIHIKRL